jgi:MFS transporter, OFA family, oxalate/formate antiporter
MAQAQADVIVGARDAQAVALPTVSAWRSTGVVLGAAIGMMCSFPSLFNGALSFFLVEWSKEFGWGRGETATAAVLSMLGMTVGAPVVGRLFDRVGAARVIGASVLLFAALLYVMSHLPASRIALGTLCFVIGLAGSGTSMVAYAGVLPLWFDKRLGMALGIGGLGAGLGVALAPFFASSLIGAVGWRGAFIAMAGLALAGGMLACALIRPRPGERAPLAGNARTGAPSENRDSIQGLTLREARRAKGFWLLLIVTLIIPFSVLGLALHLVALIADRGFSPQQAAAGISLAGISAMAARIAVGLMLDRWPAPAIAAGTMVLGAFGLVLISSATSYPLLCLAIALCGLLMGAESDLLPYMVRRYFGMRSFGSVFGIMFSAYALGSVFGPIVYGVTFDRLQSYAPVAIAAGAACFLSAVAILRMGPYRYANERTR